MSWGEDFWHPYDVEFIKRTSGMTRDSSTGESTLRQEADPEIINADVQMGPKIAESFGQTDPDLDEGEAILFTQDPTPNGQPVEVGDRVKVHHDDSGSNFTSYIIKEIPDDYAWFHESDNVEEGEFLMEKEES